MNKQKIHVFGKDAFLLGEDASGTRYYMEKFSWDCGWYWGGGYVETYTNNKNPERSRDIQSHQHFDGLFLNDRRENGFDKFNGFFSKTPYTEKEVWQICELMKTFYICREYSDTIHRGGARYTTNPAADIIKSEAEYNRVNNEVIPAIAEALYKIMEG